MSTKLPYITVPYLAFISHDEQTEVVCVVDHVWDGDEVLAVIAYDDGSVGKIPTSELSIVSLTIGTPRQTAAQQLVWQQFETGYQPFPTLDAQDVAAIAEAQGSTPEVTVTHTPYSEMGPGAGTPAPGTTTPPDAPKPAEPPESSS